MWAVRDRYGGQELALKVLTAGYGGAEVDALVREAVALSGLEGLGLPRVFAFGRLSDGRPYLVRELVDGRSLEAALASRDDAPTLERAVEWLAQAADVLTHLHRAGLLHGDIKPANVIVRADDSVTLVDLGLAAAWQDRGAVPEGLTPHYAAPEVLAGQGLTARSEVYSLGVVLREILVGARRSISADVGAAEVGGATDVGAAADTEGPTGTASESGSPLEAELVAELEHVVGRATQSDPAARYPSADELASALRHSARLPPPEPVPPDERWPVEGMDRAAAELLSAIGEMKPGALLRVQGPVGSGRTTLLRRVTWTLAMRGTSVVWLDEASCGSPEAVTRELGEGRGSDVVVVDAPEPGVRAQGPLQRLLRQQLERGARVVVVGDLELGVGSAAQLFDMPALDPVAARRLLRRAMPSLTDAMVQRVLEATGARPGPLRQLVARAGAAPLTSAQDLEQLLAWDEELSDAPEEPRQAAAFFLERGRFIQARAALDRDQALDSERAWLEARWQLGAGSAAKALEVLDQAAADGEGSSGTEPATGEIAAQLRACRGRALLGVGRYADALEVLAGAETWPERARLEALAYRGLAQSLLGDHRASHATLEAALEEAQRVGAVRLEALVASSHATALWRAEQLVDAAQMFRRAITAAERVGDAGILSSAQINLAALLKVRGELAPALEMLESAVDTARRSGRRATLHQALLNLANADLYLGRLERARSSMSAIDEAALSPVARAQLIGLRAELAEREGRADEALELYGACEAAWSALGRKRDAAEATLEALLLAVRSPSFDRKVLEGRLAFARGLLGEQDAHGPLLLIAEARLRLANGDDAGADAQCELAAKAAEAVGQREWLWRSLEVQAEVLERTGRAQRARRARQRALEVVEEIGASLPRDLREVYWNDPRRRALRQSAAEPDRVLREAQRAAVLPFLQTAHAGAGVAAVSRLTQTPLEQRLARILAVNHELAGEIDVARLCRRIVAHAAELLGADRAFLLLRRGEEPLEVQATFGVGADAQREFSSSVARRVVASGEPLVSIDAARDGRLEGYASVHRRMVRAVACVPILDPRGTVVGALHLETRGAPSPHFADELPTLRAFADQAAIALENARLLSELRARTDELETSNRQLAAARERLEEVLEARTARLKEARRELRTTRKALEANYTYEGLVGTSAPMRRLYAMIERIKQTDVPVLITGESGTGKEMVARAIHQSSPRSSGKFLGVNCGAIPEQILESELFGHVRGSFTGADRDRKGLFREANGGSLLLDEIGETPAKMQAGLLRVLQEGKVRPVGGQAEEAVDVRVIFATNRDLEALVEAGRFREDLLYRIRVVELRLPALRERSEDIPQLVDHFFTRFATRFDRPKKVLSRDALQCLLGHPWPGNVRQLENALLNAWVLSEGDVIEAEDLDLPSSGPTSAVPGFAIPGSAPLAPASRSSSAGSTRSFPPAPPRSAPAHAATSGSAPPSLPPATLRGSSAVRELQEATESKRQTASQHRRDERQRIVDALNACNWNRVKAAELIGMPRRTFYRRLHEYGIQ